MSQQPQRFVSDAPVSPVPTLHDGPVRSRIAMRLGVSALAVLVLGLMGCSANGPTRPWSFSEKVAFGVFASCQVTDALQTMQVAEDPRLEERNPLLGKEPGAGTILAAKGAVTALTYYVLDAVPNHRVAALILPTAICGATIAHNFRLGVGVDL